MSATVIMLGHKSLAGKDTVAGFVLDKGWHRVAFADKLKETVADLYGFTRDQIHGSAKDDMDLRYPNLVDPTELTKYEEDYYGPIPWEEYKVPNPDYKPYLTPRRVLQIFGQDQRKLYPDIWASYVFEQEITRQINNGISNFIVTDFRFTNEAKVAFRWAEKTGNKVICIKVHRPGVEAKTGANDVSENDLNNFADWHYQITNDKGLQELEKQVVPLFQTLT